MTVITMNRTEIDRVGVLRDVAELGFSQSLVQNIR